MQPRSARPFVGSLPPALAQRARDVADGRVDPAEPRPAATLALLRDGTEGLEVFLLRRVASMAFAAGMHVFPGGGVDPRDLDDATPWRGPDPGDWAAALSADPNLARALACAAVRETFEECGVLLASPRPEESRTTGAPSSGPPLGAGLVETAGPAWESDRLALQAHQVALSDLLARRRLVLRADLLAPWAHWLTPDFEPRRYDTRFFVAALPTGQSARHVGGEAEHSAWVRPGEAVAAYEAGQMPMLPPTIATLRELAGFDTVADVLAAAATREIARIEPRAVADGERLRLALPGDPGYPTSEERA